jgi:GTP-binding protein
MYEWIVYNGYRPIIIATKLDKLKRSQVSNQVKLVREGLGLKPEDILIPFSSETKQGLEDLWKCIDDIYNAENVTE